MTREEAMEYDNALKQELERSALQYDMTEATGDYLVDNFITVIPEDARKGMVFLGENSASYKAGNVKIDLKKALVAGLEYVASVNKPESIFNYIQMVIVSVLFVVKSVKQEIGKLEAQVVYFLHERNAYEVGIEEERLISAVQDWYKQREGGILERDNVNAALNSLYKVNIIALDDGKVYLREKVFGKAEWLA